MVRSLALAAAFMASVSLMGCGSDGGGGGTPSPTAGPPTAGPSTSGGGPATTRTTTTTKDLSDVCGAGNVVQNSRPNAASSIIAGVGTEDACCSSCNTNSSCVAWQFLAGQTECRFVQEGDAWVGMIEAEGYVFGTKRLGTCASCGYCGTDAEDLHDINRYCNHCANGENWNAYPCFVPHACKCVSSTTPSTTTLYPPSTTPGAPTLAPMCRAGSVTQGQKLDADTNTVSAKTQEACCEYCESHADCVAWQFKSGFISILDECSVVRTGSTWRGQIDDSSYSFGTKPLVPTTSAAAFEVVA